MFDAISSALQQVAVFCLIPFIGFLIHKRKLKGFWDYIGLKRSNSKANWLGFFLGFGIAAPILIFLNFSPAFKAVLTDPNTVTGAVRALGFGTEAIVTIIMFAIFKTAFAEEVLFRGFLAKRLIAVTNFKTGNVIQALIFGVIHFLLFLMITKNWIFLTFILLVPTIAAYIKVYLNEKMANGSILPGWIAHATGNVLAYSVVGFLA